MRRVTLAALLYASTPAFAAHPMLTEDTGTQGSGRFELELGTAIIRDHETRVFEFGPQLAYGIGQTVDLIVRPAWLDIRESAGGRHERGTGDTALDVKWRVFAADLISFGVRAGADVATGNHDRGLGAGGTGYHGVLIATFDAAPFAVDGNVGYARNAAANERRDLYYVSGALVWSANERYRFTAELGAFSDSDPSRRAWQVVARVGAIATVIPTLDLDVGYQTHVNRATSARIVLAGATFRW
jgi:hypothetical protein